eukprot:TRINITY_DN434_c0_g1_i1.p1 TRINITY_DN434_c0_g1~~TRINITY_DN434_c0_g1_i1.p1  ORF type:complete len:301 (+),score=55.42 TRINITY_DN434_c0_g1_i1:490-1392(+)
MDDIIARSVDWFLHDPGYSEPLTHVIPERSAAYFVSAQNLSNEKWYMLFSLFAAACIFASRLAIDKLILYFVVRGKFHMKDSEGLLKLQECGFYAMYYVFAQIAGGVVFACGEWKMWPTVDLFVDYPLQPFYPFERLYMLVELGFYIHALVYTLKYDPKRSDWVEFVIHHLSTIVLVGVAYFTRQFRVSILILMAHNISDIFLYTAKYCKYLGWDAATDFLFIVFAGTFFLSRIVIMPFALVFATGVEVGEYMPLWSLQFPLFCVLQMLHVFWFGLIIKVARKKFQDGGSVEDLREKVDE